MTGMYGINSYYYTRILFHKKSIRNQLILFEQNACEGETILAHTQALAPLFLIDADNINGEFYGEADLAVVDPIMDAFLCGESFARDLSVGEVRTLIDLALHRRLTLERNEQLAVKLAEEYNACQQNELLRINMEIFRQICRDIDYGRENS